MQIVFIVVLFSLSVFSDAMYYYFMITAIQVTFHFDILNLFLALGVTSRGLPLHYHLYQKTQAPVGFKNLLTS